MLIGAVENVTPEEVSGWMYSQAADLHGSLALAFVDGACVGSGRVELFRQDLADAGLSHGKLGFHFPISLPAEDAAGRLVVGLERCEAVFLQRGSKVVGQPEERERALVGGELPGAETVSWLRARGAVSEAEADFLGRLGEFGVAAWPLRSGRGDAKDKAAAARQEAASAIVQLCGLARARAASAEFAGAEGLAAALEAEDHPISRAGLLLFGSDRTLNLTVVEGSHRTHRRALIADALDRGIRYAAEPACLLAVHRRCAFRLEAPAHRGFTVHFPQAAAPARAGG